ncbi:MAG: peptidylprolyl isomerase [Proteobacteria bacterium]|nr:peptidylprolyl isomerase [Pseudomonadota bacterium]
MRTVLLRETLRPSISVNGTVIPNGAIAREVQNHTGGSPLEAWQEATRALVIRELLLQRAQTLGLQAQPRSVDGLRETDEEALIRAVLEHDVRTPTADEDTCRRYYQANKTRFRTPDLFEPRHVLFQARSDDEAAYAHAFAKATAALELVRARPDCFEALAHDLSDCPSRERGGLLGQVVAGDTTLAFDAALRTLQPGETCAEPVRTRYGVHVVRLERRTGGQILPFEDVYDRIAAYLEERSQRKAMAQYISRLAGEAVITGFDMQGTASPLLQ